MAAHYVTLIPTWRQRGAETFRAEALGQNQLSCTSEQVCCPMIFLWPSWFLPTEPQIWACSSQKQTWATFCLLLSHRIFYSVRSYMHPWNTDPLEKIRRPDSSSQAVSILLCNLEQVTKSLGFLIYQMRVSNNYQHFASLVGRLNHWRCVSNVQVYERTQMFSQPCGLKMSSSSKTFPWLVRVQ